MSRQTEPNADDRAAALLAVAAADVPADVDEATRARLRRRIVSTLGPHRRAPILRLRYALVVVLALAGGGVVGASVHSVITRRAATRAAGATTEVSAAPRAVAVRRAPSRTSARPEVAPPAAVEPAEVSPPALSPPLPLALSTARDAPRRPVPAVVPAPVAPSLAPPAPSDSDDARLESTVLADAIQKLRAGGDPASALAVLDQHRARLGRGPLAAEASVLRVEALLQQRKDRDALAELEGLPIDALPRRTEWHVIRGELRAGGGNWAGAEADFAAALERLAGAGGEIAQRALWGRAVARARRGDAAGANADYRAYLQRFPTGRFAADARARVPAP